MVQLGTSLLKKLFILVLLFYKEAFYLGTSLLSKLFILVYFSFKEAFHLGISLLKKLSILVSIFCHIKNFQSWYVLL